jgi:hypothetical protein
MPVHVCASPEIVTSPDLNVAVHVPTAVLGAETKCHVTADRNGRCLGRPLQSSPAAHGLVAVHVLRACCGDAVGNYS